jgi:hypothetical protein
MKRRRRLGSSEHDSAREGVQSFKRAVDARASSGGAAGPNAGAGVGAEYVAAEKRRSVRAFLMGAVQAAFVIPVLFYLRFGEINAFALSFTGFIVVLCLLVALGYSIPDRPEHQAQARAATAKAGVAGRVGSLWLPACAFGPFFGWVVTAAFTLTEDNWRWLYVVRAALCVGLPVLTALPLTAKVRGKYAHVALLLLVCVTALPVWSGLNTLLDLREGPTLRSTTGYYDAPNNSFRPAADGRPYRLKTLAHTGRSIKVEPATPVERKD